MPADEDARLAVGTNRKCVFCYNDTYIHNIIWRPPRLLRKIFSKFWQELKKNLRIYYAEVVSLQPIEPAVSFMKQRGLTLIGIPLAVFLVGLLILKYALLVMPLTFGQYRDLLLHIASVSATLLGLLFAAMAILFNISETKKSIYFIRLLDNLTSTTFLLFFSLLLSTMLYMHKMHLLTHTAAATIPNGNITGLLLVTALYFSALIMTFATILTMVDIYRYDAELQMRFDSRGFTYRK